MIRVEREGADGAIATVVVAVAMGHALSWISASIGTSVKTAQTAEAAGVVWIFPLVFLSSVFVPVAIWRYRSLR